MNLVAPKAVSELFDEPNGFRSDFVEHLSQA
jgi:hypothetical protein